MLEQEIEKILIDNGAIKVGFATLETMASDIPSTDLTYVLPVAKSAVSFAIPLDKEKIRPYLRKDLPNARIDIEKDQLDSYKKIIQMTREVEDYLKEKGHETKIILPNLKYRRDFPEGPLTFEPTISLRYLAVASGVGTFGWSGNVGIKDVGAPILLGGLVTSAQLTPTDPLPNSESHCNKCKLCVNVCGFRMFSGDEEVEINIGGRAYKYSKRVNRIRCFIVCGGYSGLDKTGKWSTWCPERFPYPETDDDLYHTFGASLKKFPTFPVKGEDEARRVDRKEFSRDKVIKQALKGNRDTTAAFSFLSLTCGNCQLICAGNPKETKENYDLLTNSGCTVRDKDGYIDVMSCEEAASYPESNILDVNRELSPKRKETADWVRSLYE